MWLTVFIAAAATAACGASPYPAHALGNEGALLDGLRPPTADAVTLVGRFETLPGGNAVRYAWPNSAMGFRFEGDSIGVVLAEDTPHRIGKSVVHNMYEVVVDGEIMPPITVEATTPRVFTIAEGLAPGPHTVWLTKRTEAMVGSGIFFGFDVPSGTQLLPPPPLRRRRIEVYGASNEAGYGNLGKATRRRACTYTPSTQNAAVAYPALAAEALQADLVNISFSGKGMLGTCTPGDVTPLPALADRIDPHYPTLRAWGTAPAPDVVLLTLGANDFAGGVPNKTAFKQAYQTFLHKLRRQYPNAAIVCTVTPMIDGKDRKLYRHWLESVIASTGDARISLLAFPTYTGYTLGCDAHPDEALHEALARQLEKTVLRVTGWR